MHYNYSYTTLQYTTLDCTTLSNLQRYTYTNYTTPQLQLQL